MQRGITLPLTQVEFGILCAMVVLGGLIGWWFWAARLESRTKGRDRSTSEHLLEIFSWLLAPVWAALILFTLYLMWRVGNRLMVLGPGEDLRWYALGFVGLVTAFGAVVSAPLALIRVATTERQTRTAEQGHMTDRISKAVEQLGTEKTVKKDDKETTEPNLEVRIGGLLSLERIAQDSTAYDKGRDHVRVMEIICAYIRNNAPASQAKDFPLGDLEPLPEDATPEQRETHLAYVKLRGHQGRNLQDWARSLPGPREDIMLALRILERRSDKQRRIEAAHGQKGIIESDWVFSDPAPELPEPPEGQSHPKGAVAGFRQRITTWRRNLEAFKGYRPDLRHTCLQHADLSSFRLSGVSLDEARAEGADLRGARMEGAVLRGARMEGANLSVARMEGANLWSAQMAGADLIDTRMDGANLFGAHMEGAFLIGARVQGAVSARVRMRGAILTDAWMNCANLSRAHLEGANLSRARMEEAVLTGAWMGPNTILIGVDLSRAAHKSVSYITVAISQDQVIAGFGDESVLLPEGLDRPKHWPDWRLGMQFYDEWRRWRENPEAYTPPPAPSG